MNQERIRRTFALAYVATGIAQACEVGYNYLLYKSFSVSEIGLLSWAAALILFFNVAVDMGVEPILIRRFGKADLSLARAFKATFLLRGPLIIIAAAFLTSFFASGRLGAGEYWMLLLIGGQILFNVSDGVSKAWLRANGRQTTTNFVSALLGALKLGAIVFLTYRQKSTIYDLLGSLLVIRAVGSLVAFQIAASLDGPGREGNAEGLLRTTLNLLKAGVVIGAISALTAAQNRLDWLLVSRFISTEALATYSLANKFYEISQVVVGVAVTTIYPWLCRATADNEGLYSILLRVIVVGGVMLGVGGVVLAPPLIGALFGDKYAGIDTPVQILMLAVGFMAASGVLYTLALARGRERPLLVIAIVTTTVQFACNWWLIPKLGVAGAALGMLILVVGAALGQAVIMMIDGLVSGALILRAFGFLAVFPCLPLLVLRLEIPVWLAGPICVAAVAVLGWRILFNAAERRIIFSEFAPWLAR